MTAQPATLVWGPVEHIRLVGRLDTASCPPLERALDDLHRSAARRGFPACVHLDLTSVTSLTPAAVPLLNRVYVTAGQIGGAFRVTPPRAGEPHATFVRAAIRGEFDWACGSVGASTTASTDR